MFTKPIQETLAERNAERRGLKSLAERNKSATKAVGIRGRSRPTLQHARVSLSIEPRWHLIMCPTVELTAGLVLAHAAPLLKEERDARGTALVADRPDPVRLHRPGTRPAFSSQNDPADAG